MLLCFCIYMYRWGLFVGTGPIIIHLVAILWNCIADLNGAITVGFPIGNGTPKETVDLFHCRICDIHRIVYPFYEETCKAWTIP